MVLKSVTELSIDFHDVRAALLRTPREWLAGLTAEAGRIGDRLVLELGLDVAGNHTGDTVGLPLDQTLDVPGVLMLPLRLSSRDHRRLFPVMEGTLDAAWLGRDRTYLSLSLAYDPPLGLVGIAVDRALLHRVAETIAGRLLEAVAQELAGTDERSRPAAGGTA